MKRRTDPKRLALLAASRAAKAANHWRGSGDSRYARKSAWLARHGKWGWEVPEPKPWK